MCAFLLEIVFIIYNASTNEPTRWWNSWNKRQAKRLPTNRTGIQQLKEVGDQDPMSGCVRWATLSGEEVNHRLTGRKLFCNSTWWTEMSTSSRHNYAIKKTNEPSIIFTVKEILYRLPHVGIELEQVSALMCCRFRNVGASKRREITLIQSDVTKRTTVHAELISRRVILYELGLAFGISVSQLSYYSYYRS